MEALGPMLSTIFVSLMPLIDIYPNKVANMFYFMVKENQQHLKNYIAELYFLDPHLANPIVFNIVQQYTKNVLYVFSSVWFSNITKNKYILFLVNNH